MLTDQEMIEQAIIGKRIVAINWLPASAPFGDFELQSITLGGGVQLMLSVWITNPRERDVVVVEIEEQTDRVNARCVCPLCNQGHDPQLVGDGGEGKDANT